MGLKSTTRRLMTFASQDPWRAIEKSKYANKETAYWLVDQVDEAIYESNIDQALLLSFLLRRIAEKVGDPHVHCRASAVMGSAYRLASLYSLANRMLRQAEKYAADCPECRGEVCRRWGVVLHYEHQHEAALAKLEKAIHFFNQTSYQGGICRTLMTRGFISYTLGRYEEAFRDEEEAARLLVPSMPSRLFMISLINTTTALSALDSPEYTDKAFEYLEHIQAILKGERRRHETVRVMLRWVRGLLYEKIGNNDYAARSLESAESGMKRLAMTPALRVLYADLARVRKRIAAIEQIASKALAIESSAEVQGLIERVKREPTPEALMAWREAVDAYVPVFRASA